MCVFIYLFDATPSMFLLNIEFENNFKIFNSCIWLANKTFHDTIKKQLCVTFFPSLNNNKHKTHLIFINI